MHHRLLVYLPVLSAAMLLAALMLFITGTGDKMARTKRCQSYLLYAREWVEDQRTSPRPGPTGGESPWGGWYKKCEALPGKGQPALLISGFPPAGTVEFSSMDHESLVKAWDLEPIPNAKLVFHFNGLPVVLITR